MRTDSPEWIAAKAEGDSAELAIARWFRSRGFDTFKTFDRADFDLLLQCAVEVKADRMAVRTGNVAIETHYRGQPSGILTSPATWWAIVVEREAFIVKRDALRKLVLTGTFDERAAGDGKAATVRLVPVNNLRELEGAAVVPLPVEADARD